MSTSTPAAPDDAFAGMRERGSAGHFAPITRSPLAAPLLESSALEEIWRRPELSTREHLLAHIGLMSVLNRPHEFREHLRGALRAGVQPEEIVAVFLHTKHYAGMPAAVDAMLLLLEVIDDDATA